MHGLGAGAQSAGPQWASADLGLRDQEIDMVRLRAWRLARLQAQLRRLDAGCAILTDPMNIRYACGSRNMAVWTAHTPARYCLVPAEGKVTLWDFHNCEFLADGLETVAEVRPARGFYFFGAGSRVAEKAAAWGREMAAMIAAGCGGNRRVAIDRLDPPGTHALQSHGIEIIDGQEPCEMARAVKSADEIACMIQAIAACEAGMARMQEALQPGITENALWALLHETNIRLGGEWIECRLLASGERTNPWFQECSDRVIEAGDLVAFDTDLIGPFGYCADISRTYFCGPGRPSAEQRRLYAIAHEQVQYNIERLMRPGLSFREAAHLAWEIPGEFVGNRYSSVAHGVGLCDEWPKITHPQDVERSAYDGVLEPGMVMCVESYIGAAGGREGVKLEQQVLITETGCRLLSTYPFEEALLA